MGHCKHNWEDRTDVLRALFHLDAEKLGSDYYVCTRCLRIDEVRATHVPLDADPFTPSVAA